jgi:ABC-2 type transport system permease protein
MNLLIAELKRSFRSWLNYTFSILATFVIFVWFFDFFKEDAALLDKLLQNFPQEFKAAFGFADVKLGEISGYLSFVSSYIILVGAVYGMKLGVSLLSEESRKKTADFLLSKPVRRWQVVTAKLETALICLVAQNIAFFGLGLVALKVLVDETIDIPIFTLQSFTTLYVQLFFLGLGFAIAALASKIKSVMPITLGIVFFFFIIQMINDLAYLTPFAYFKGSAILANRHYSATYLAIDLVFFVVTTAFSYYFYNKKDIHAV